MFRQYIVDITQKNDIYSVHITMYRKIKKYSNAVIYDISTKLTIQRHYQRIACRDGDMKVARTACGNFTSGDGNATWTGGNCKSCGGTLHGTTEILLIMEETLLWVADISLDITEILLRIAEGSLRVAEGLLGA